MTTVVILGATGVVGSGAALAWAKAGARVVLGGRNHSKLEDLKKTLLGKDSSIKESQLVLAETGDFETDEKAQGALATVKKAIGGDGAYEHVVSILGFASLSNTPPTQTPSSTLTNIINTEFMPTYRAAGAFLPPLKNVEGSSYSIVSGGLAHGVFFPAAWTATIKNSMINTFLVTLAAETKNDKVRVNVLCIHYGVAAFGGEKNQFGMPSSDTSLTGPVFVAVGKNQTKKGEVICLNNVEATQEITKNLS